MSIFEQKVAAAIRLLSEHPGFIQTQPDETLIAAINVYLSKWDGA